VSTLDVKFTDINAFIEAGNGEAYHFEYAGKAYVVECWATTNGSGQDIYDAESQTSANPFTVDESEEFFELLSKVEQEYHQQWQKLVNPAIQTAVERTLAEANSPT